MASRSLVSKIKRALDDGGIFGLLKRTEEYAVRKIKSGIKRDEMRDILFVNGCTLPHPERYRVDHQIEQLEAYGLTTEKVLYTAVKPEKIKYYRAVVIFRCPITPEVKELIEKAHYFNKKVFFDIDDLVIDKKYTDTIKFVQEMKTEERKTYDDGVVRMGKTMELCDYLITTTPALKRELEKYGKEVFINKNTVSEEMVKLSLEAMKKVEKQADKIRIGYLSGSITHNPDFELVKPALIKLMDEYPEVELVLMGYLDLPRDLSRFGERIVKLPFCSWEKLPAVIAGLDINLAPIEETVFNEAKSENKWTEAALCRVVTVASDFGAFKNVVKDGETGVLCKTPQDWYEKMKKLISDANLRGRIAENAYRKVMKEYVTTYSGRGLAEFIKSKLAHSVVFVLPSTNISGGVNVTLKHCNILRDNNCDVTVLNMDTSDENIINDDGEINVVSVTRHEVKAHFDNMVATLFTTLKYVKEYPDVKKRSYLVQNFETEFNDYGSPVKREANATYTEQDVNYLTISKWCKDWLFRDFGQKAKYAPNGLDLDKFKYRERNLDGKIKILVEGNSDDYYKNVDESFRITNKLDKNKYEIVYLSYQGEPKSWYKFDKFYHRVPHDEVGNVYRECDILLKTSILESFSYPPLEMMATGGYVVVIPNGGNQEYLKDGENCLFYEQGNIDEAISKIQRLEKDVELRKKIMENSKKVVEGRDWNKLEKEVLELYS
ncbi:MAG: glycosyltransferase [Candidatus Saccharibacteria bacterium]|nr:glycosyltransferase [Candidatus Saccharibacteria bacterium]